jgi:uncharacterized protein YjbI with pentapeptide repeats
MVLEGPEWETFEREIATLFQLQGYSVRRKVLISGKKVDVYAEKRLSQFTVERLAVECKFYGSTLPGDVVKEVIGTVPALVGTGQCDLVVLVSNQRPSEYAMRLIDDTRHLRFLTYEQLLYGIIDFTPYVWKFIRAYEGSELFNSYIPLKASFCPASRYRDYLSEPSFPFKRLSRVDLAGFVEYCLRCEDARHVCVLGDYGTGKTSFALTLTYNRLKEYLRDPFGNPIPVYIALREYSKSFDVRSMITDHLVNAYSVRTDFFSFQELLKAGKLLLVLDGFDEMSMTVDWETRARHFLVLSELLIGRAKIVLTGRLAYFFSTGDLDSFLHRGAHGNDLAEERYARITDGPSYDVLVLRPFSRTQISTFVKSRAPYLISQGIQEWTEVRDAILGSFTLADLSSRPVLLDMLVKAAPFVDDLSDLTTARLYDLYTKFWTDRDYRKGEFRHLLDRDLKERLMEDLALEMFHQGVRAFSIGKLRDNIAPLAELLGIAVVEEQFAYFEHDIRTCSFLTLDVQDDYYRFAHDSFFEFFLARRLVNMLVTEGAVQGFLARQLLRDEVLDFMEQILRAESDGEGVISSLETALRSAQDLRIAYPEQTGSYFFTNLLRLLCRLTGGAPRLQLRDLQIPSLALDGADLEGGDFSSTQFTNLALHAVNLSRSSFAGSALRGGRFDRCQIVDAVFTGATITGSDFRECNLTGADLSGVTFGPTGFADSCLRGCDLRDSDLRYVDFSRGDLTGCDFTGARVDLRKNRTKFYFAKMYDVKGIDEATFHAICEDHHVEH